MVAAIVNAILPEEDPVDDTEGVIDALGQEHGDPDVERIGDVEDIHHSHVAPDMEKGSGSKGVVA